MAEVVLKAVFDISVAVSTGPDILLFKKLQTEWPNINQKQYTCGVGEEFMVPLIQEKSIGLTDFIKQRLNVRYLKHL